MRLITKSGTADFALQSASRALPARLYRDPDVVELEQRRVFERTWQLAVPPERFWDTIARTGEYQECERSVWPQRGYEKCFDKGKPVIISQI